MAVLHAAAGVCCRRPCCIVSTHGAMFATSPASRPLPGSFASNRPPLRCIHGLYHAPTSHKVCQTAAIAPLAPLYVMTCNLCATAAPCASPVALFAFFPLPPKWPQPIICTWAQCFHVGQAWRTQPDWPLRPRRTHCHVEVPANDTSMRSASSLCSPRASFDAHPSLTPAPSFSAIKEPGEQELINRGMRTCFQLAVAGQAPWLISGAASPTHSSQQLQYGALIRTLPTFLHVPLACSAISFGMTGGQRASYVEVAKRGEEARLAEAARRAEEAKRAEATKRARERQFQNLNMLNWRLNWMVAAETFLLGAIATLFPTSIPDGLACPALCTYGAVGALLKWLVVIGMLVACATLLGVCACISWDMRGWHLRYESKDDLAFPPSALQGKCPCIPAAFVTYDWYRLILSYLNYLAIPVIFIISYRYILPIISSIDDCLNCC